MITWIDIENITLSEMSDKCNMISLFAEHVGKNQTHRKQMVIRGRGVEEGGLEEGDHKVKFPA